MLWTSVIQTGLIAGYCSTCMQLTPGYGKRFEKLRSMADKKLTELSLSDYKRYDRWDSLHQLIRCGWCLAPFVTLPVWVTVARINRVRGLNLIVGYACSVALTAMVRHWAEVM